MPDSSYRNRLNGVTKMGYELIAEYVEASLFGLEDSLDGESTYCLDMEDNSALDIEEESL